jgi:hypothetical protein
MLGISDTGSLPEATIPNIINARKVIITATGLVIKNFTIILKNQINYYLFTPCPLKGVRRKIH